VADPYAGLFPALHLSDHPDVANLLKEWYLFIDMLMEHLARAQNRMKLQADHTLQEI
jgi:hypothetical protein